MDRLTSMGVFTKAVETGSFSSAADALRMSSQLVGKHVQTLEQHLGVRLIHRTTRRQHLTDAGTDFYERVKIILADVEAAEGIAAISRATPRGRLRVNAPVTFGVHALSARLPEYLAHHPDVTIEMSLSNHNVDLIDEGFDVAFRVGELADSGLMARALAPYRLSFCVRLRRIWPAARPSPTPMTANNKIAWGFHTPNCARAGHWMARRGQSRSPFPAS